VIVQPVVSGLIIGVAAQRPGEPFRLALIGYAPGAKTVQVRSVAEVRKLMTKHHATSIIWEGDNDTFHPVPGSPGAGTGKRRGPRLATHQRQVPAQPSRQAADQPYDPSHI
jgi:hypothetical protein